MDINNIGAVNTAGLSQVIKELKQTSQLAAGVSLDSINDTRSVDFGTVLKDTINSVNAKQQASHQMAKEYEAGSSDVSLQDVMISLQKASLTFQTMTQVRNKLVTAYQEVMNMQV